MRSIELNDHRGLPRNYFKLLNFTLKITNKNKCLRMSTNFEVDYP